MKVKQMNCRIGGEDCKQSRHLYEEKGVGARRRCGVATAAVGDLALHRASAAA